MTARTPAGLASRRALPAAVRYAAATSTESLVGSPSRRRVRSCSPVSSCTMPWLNMWASRVAVAVATALSLRAYALRNCSTALVRSRSPTSGSLVLTTAIRAA